MSLLDQSKLKYESVLRAMTLKQHHRVKAEVDLAYSTEAKQKLKGMERINGWDLIKYTKKPKIHNVVELQYGTSRDTVRAYQVTVELNSEQRITTERGTVTKNVKDYIVMEKNTKGNNWRLKSFIEESDSYFKKAKK